MPEPILPRPINPTVSMLPPVSLERSAHSNSASYVLQAAQVGNLAKMLVFLANQLTKHATDGEVIGQGTPATRLRKRDALGMDIEGAGVNATQVGQGFLAHSIKVALQFFDIRMREARHLCRRIAHARVIFWQTAALIPTIALPHLSGVLGKAMQPAVLDAGDVPHHEADRVGFRPGTPHQLSGRETLQGAIQAPFTLVEGLFNKGFEVHGHPLLLTHACGYDTTSCVCTACAAAHLLR